MRSLDVSKMFLQLTGLFLFLTLPGVGQAQERTINKVSWRTEPIKLVRLQTKGKPIELGKKFVEDDDWLKRLTVTVENISNKLISRIELSLFFPRPEGTSETIPTYTVPMGYGLDPSDIHEGEAQNPVYPGESVDVKMLEVNLPVIKTDVKSLDYPEKITLAEIMVESVTFIDGSMWAEDEILYPDPTDSNRKFNPKFSRPEGSNQRPGGDALSVPFPGEILQRAKTRCCR